jgi:hypothetical protein
MKSTSAVRVLSVASVLFVLFVIAPAIMIWSPGPLPVPPPLGEVVSEPPAGIVILPGYAFTPYAAADVADGLLKKDGGPSISYEVGVHHVPLLQDANSRDIDWQKHLTIRGNGVDVFMFGGGERASVVFTAASLVAMSKARRTWSTFSSRLSLSTQILRCPARAVRKTHPAAEPPSHRASDASGYGSVDSARACSFPSPQ